MYVVSTSPPPPPSHRSLLQNNRVNSEFMNKLSEKEIYVDLKNVRILFIYLDSRFLSNYTLQFGKE